MNLLLRLPEAEETQLRNLFPGLVELTEFEDEAHSYKHRSVSIFDHLLTEEEYDRLLVDVAPAEQVRRNQLHMDMIRVLLGATRVLTFQCDPDRIPQTIFFTFTSEEAAIKYFEHTRSQRYVAALPEYRAVYLEGYDDTSHLFYFDDSLVNPVLSLAKRVGLYVW